MTDTTISLFVSGGWSLVSGIVMTYYSRALAQRSPEAKPSGLVWVLVLCMTFGLMMAGSLTVMLAVARARGQSPP